MTRTIRQTIGAIAISIILFVLLSNKPYSPIGENGTIALTKINLHEK